MVTYLNSWFKLPTLGKISQEFTSQTREHTLKLCEAFETLHKTCEPKHFGKEGAISHPCEPSLHSNGQQQFTRLTLTAFELGPYTLSKMNFGCWIETCSSEQHWPRTRHRCVRAVCLGRVVFRGKWLHRFIALNGVRGSQYRQGLCSWFSVLLKIRGWHLPHKPVASPLHLLSREVTFCRQGGRNSVSAVQSRRRHKAWDWLSYGAVNLAWLAAEQLRDEISSALLKRRVFYTRRVSAQRLSWTDNFILALPTKSTCLQRGEFEPGLW